MMQCHKCSGGFTLIEVLVAIVIFSIGMLGLLGLTSNGLLMTYTANYTTTGAQLAYAMADRVRANATKLGSYNQPGDAYTVACFPGDDDSIGCNTVTAEDQIVQTEFKQWRDTVAATLPQGVGEVCRDASPNDGNPDDEFSCDGSVATAPYVVKVCWSNRTGAGRWSCYRVII